jgi:hypothetical protein
VRCCFKAADNSLFRMRLHLHQDLPWVDSEFLLDSCFGFSSCTLNPSYPRGVP